ncbi:mate recognition motif repeat [Brachionus plicatilis]|uniref:Mate recognition motif repeat n=1 Tax=Brachionus plicatilis TaxID=10195 RepID=A0A3M7SM67_BRAPC|nr:mate recognition motif repeat [Brachionus plicatilis]
MGTYYWNQIKQIATQLLFAGQQIWQQATVVFQQLVADLQNHATDALPLVVQAIGQLTALVGQSGKRDLVDFALNSLGLGQVIDTIQALGTDYWNQIKQIATQLLFAGQQIWQQATVVFQQLVADLQNHATDALPLVVQAIGQLTDMVQD